MDEHRNGRAFDDNAGLSRCPRRNVRQGPSSLKLIKNIEENTSQKSVAFNHNNHNNLPHFYYFLIPDRAGSMSYSNSTDSSFNSENNTFIIKLTITCSILLSVCKSCTNRGTIPVLITSSIGGFGSDRQNKIIRPQNLYMRLFKITSH